MKAMRSYGTRTIKVKRVELLNRIKENKAIHIKEYEEAIVAYKEEALKQLSSLTKKAQEGSLRLELKLVHPVNKADEYDKLILMFQMEVEDVVELQQDEFNAYIFDELDFSTAAKMSNTHYMNRL
jgi:hypothetical protein